MTRNNGSRWGHRAWLAAACIVLATGLTGATQQLYSLEIPDGQAATFEVPFEVEHAGELSLRANWSGKRLLAFRIEPPAGSGKTVRRNGSSPIRINVHVEEEQIGQGPWTVVIHALPVSGAATGRLTIDLPESTALQVKELPPAGLYAPEPKRPEEAWQRARRSSDGLSAEHQRILQSTESFRTLIVDSKRRAPDTCRWQDDLLQWLATQRDLAIDEAFKPEPATGKLMKQMVDAIRAVDEVRTSRDPVLVGPTPANQAKRLSWLRLREGRLRPVEDRLDEVLNAVQRNHAPELEGEQWPMRMVSCLMASERFFDQRWLSGVDRAPNRDLAEAQWRPLNSAATALEALAGLAEEETIRLRRR